MFDDGDTKSEEDEEAATERIVRKAMTFQAEIGGEGDKLVGLVDRLPREWKVVQVMKSP